MLRNAVGGGRVSDFPEKNVTTMFLFNVITVTGRWLGVEFPEKNVP